jgi:hypothetical protein
MHSSLNYVDSTFNIKRLTQTYVTFTMSLNSSCCKKARNTISSILWKSTLNLKTYFKVIGGVKYTGCIFSLSLLTKPSSHCNVLSRNGASSSWVPENVLTCGHCHLWTTDNAYSSSNRG